MNWDDLKLFLEVARAGQLSAAAKVLHLDPATLSRRIARLEQRLDRNLFLKSLQGYQLTQAGETLLAHARQMEASSKAIETGLAETSDDLSGTIRIGAPDGSANFLLPQVCRNIADQNPDLQIQIVALPQTFNLSKREADMAVAVADPKAAHLDSQFIAPYHLHLAAHRDYLAAHPPIKSKSDLKNHRIIGYISDLIFTPELDYLSELGAGIEAQLSSNSVSVQMNWAAQMSGLSITHDFALPAFPALQKVLADQISLTRRFYLIRHQDEMRDNRLSRFADILVQEMRAEIARLEGLSNI